jgi:hypothetical protein
VAGLVGHGGLFFVVCLQQLLLATVAATLATACTGGNLVGRSVLQVKHRQGMVHTIVATIVVVVAGTKNSIS